MKRILELLFPIYAFIRDANLIFYSRHKTFDRAIIFFALRSTMLRLVHLLLTPRKFDIFGCRQIRRDLVATVSSKVGRLPLPDIISTNVPRS